MPSAAPTSLGAGQVGAAATAVGDGVAVGVGVLEGAAVAVGVGAVEVLAPQAVSATNASATTNQRQCLWTIATPASLAVEDRPADVVPQSLVVENELANRLRELVALPPALELPCGLAVSFRR